MPLKVSDITSSDNHMPSEAEVLRYVEGNMTRDEAYQFEKQMATSEFLSIAVEGLILEKEGNQSAIADINDRINAKIRGKAKVLPLFSYRNVAMAATIILSFAFAIIYFINNRSEDQAHQSMVLVQNNSGKTLTFVIIEPERIIVNSEKGQSINDEKEETLNTIAPAKTKESGSNFEQLDDQAKSSGIFEGSPAGASGAASQFGKEEEIHSDAINSLSLTPSYDSIANAMLVMNFDFEEDKSLHEKPKKRLALSEDRIRAQPNQAPSAGKSASTKDLNNKSEHTMGWDEQTRKLIQGDNYESAIENLNSIISFKDSRLEMALWYKSICLLKQNHVEQTKKTLFEIVELNRLYKEKAAEVLKRIE